MQLKAVALRSMFTSSMRSRVFSFAKIVLPLGLFASATSWADQPVFNEMPRWRGGWGVQAVYEHRTEDHLLLKDNIIARDHTETVDLLHLEGVYTWDKSIRMTVKIPYVLDAEREQPGADGKKEIQTDNGLGDITLALPLKKYFNLSQRSGSWTLAPQVRVPSSDPDGDYDVYDSEWGVGLGVGYETETSEFLFAIGASVWTYFNQEPVEGFANLDLARNFIFGEISGHLKWENDLYFEDDGSGSLTYMTGPALYLRLTDLWHIRCSYKHDVYDRQGVADHASGSRSTAGIACVF